MEWITVGVVVAVIVVAGLAFMVWMADNRSRNELKSKFGREYDAVEEELGGRRAAERELRERQQRVEGFQLRPLSDRARDRFAAEWHYTQAQFVDNPSTAIREADKLVQDVMRDRGYPTEKFTQREADLSVSYPDLLSNYRSAHQIALKNESGEADTEEQRVAVIYYRSMFEELLDEREPVGPGASPRINGADH